MGAYVGLTDQQITFFTTFGFLKLPGLFRDDIDAITAGFEEVFADESHARIETHDPLHGQQRRVIIPTFVDRSAALRGLKDDPRIVSVVSALLGDDYDYAESDGNLLDCDTSWHCDIFGSPMEYRHVKLLFYLDPQRADSGAIRAIPGTNHFRETFACTLRKQVEVPTAIASELGVDGADLPAWTLETDPGDVVALDFRTIHATFTSSSSPLRRRRRLFTINFRERHPSTPKRAPRVAATA